ncbi:MAG: hypothetical protein OHK0036_06150 [Bacteroidia bacterium]
MKKVAIILTAAVTTALLSSCAKDYTCTCAYTIEPDDSTSILTTTTIKYKVKKKNSEDPCNSLEESLNANPNYGAVSCAVE